MSAAAVVSKYSKALFDVTYQKGNAGEAAKQITEIAKALSGDVLAFFENPFNSAENKLSVIKSALEGKCSAEAYNFCVTLVENNRLGLLAEIAKDFSLLVQSSAGITKGKLYSSSEVSTEFIKQAEEKASKALGRKVELVFEKNQNLIAGYKIEVAGWTLDDSAQAHLKILKDNLIKKGL